MRDRNILGVRGLVKVFTPSTFHEGLRFDRTKDKVYLLPYTPSWMKESVLRLAEQADVDVDFMSMS